MQVSSISTCRLCGSSKLTPVIDLGYQYIQTLFFKPLETPIDFAPVKTELVLCEHDEHGKGCGLLQLTHTVSPETLYTEYWYRSGINVTMRSHLKKLATTARSYIAKKHTTILDIGCNDGTMLMSYPKEDTKIGIDPSTATQFVEPDTRVTIISDAFPSKKLAKAIPSFSCDIITAIAMMYDLDNPIAFVKEVHRLLSPRGIFMFEVAYLPTMLAHNSYDTICHEHLLYYSLTTINELLNKTQFKLIDAQKSNINGGSIRCVAVPISSTRKPTPDAQKRIERYLRQENTLKLETVTPYHAFQKRIDAEAKTLVQTIMKLTNEGKTIHVYGASTKVNTILQYAGITHTLIPFASERNPEKYGRVTPGSRIPIISEADSRAMNPDYYLVLPWSFMTEFLKREKHTLESGTRFIIPLPYVSIIPV